MDKFDIDWGCGAAATLYRGDCLEAMGELPDGSVDMVLCDLPYGTTRCAWDIVIPFEPLWECYRRVAKPDAAHIARKYDIAVSTVHSCYTSKMCPVCGCIDDENRPNQETFECVECGHKHNADYNASINIRNRVTVAVLRNSLLKQDGNGTYTPKPLKRDKVKDVLLSYRSSELLKGNLLKS